MGSFGKDRGLKKGFELILDEGCGVQISGCFAFEIEVATTPEENTVVNVTEVIVAPVEVECALEGEVGDRFGDENLCAGRINVQFGQELAGESVCAND